MFLNGTTTLTMLPVCDECGTVIRDFEVDLLPNKVGDVSWISPKIYPPNCPNCGAHIDSLQMDGKYVKLFMRR